MKSYGEIKVFPGTCENSLILIRKISMSNSFIISEIFNLENNNFKICNLVVNSNDENLKEFSRLRKYSVSGNRFVSLHKLYLYCQSINYDGVVESYAKSLGDLSSRLSTYNLNILFTYNIINKEIWYLYNKLSYLTPLSYKNVKVFNLGMFENIFEINYSHLESDYLKSYYLMNLFQVVYGYSILNCLELSKKGDFILMRCHFRNRILELVFEEVMLEKYVNCLGLSSDLLIDILNFDLSKSDFIYDLYKI